MIVKSTTRIALAASLCFSWTFTGFPALSAEDVPILSVNVPTVLRATPQGRVAIGRGEDYSPAGEGTDPEVLFAQLRDNMKLRRDFAWEVVDRLLTGTRLKLPGSNVEVDVPLWQTWYDGMSSEVPDHQEELTGLFKSYFEKLKNDPTAAATRNGRSRMSDEALDEQASKLLGSSITVDRFTAVLRQNAGPNVSTKFGGQGSTIYSPSFVKHMMVFAKEVENCHHTGIKPSTPPPSPSNFSHCFDEFPRNAVMVKTSWVNLADGVANHDTSTVGIRAVMNEGTWPGGSHGAKIPAIVSPTSNEIYTNETAATPTQPSQKFGLVGIHFVTKDVREWVWISLWWNPSPNEDFGADRPVRIGRHNNGVWANYKMCVSSAFTEGDPVPWSHYGGSRQSLAESLRTTHLAIQNHIANGVNPPTIVNRPRGPVQTAPNAAGPWPAPHNKVTSWCSNPFVEVHPGNGRTSCIGCHQLVLTESRKNRGSASAFNEATEGYAPQFARSREFKNFSTDFSWGFQFEFRGFSPGRGVIPRMRNDVGFNWP